MKKYIFNLPVLLTTSLAFAGTDHSSFAKEDVEKLQTQTVGQVFCAAPRTYNIQQACKDLASSPETLSWNISTIEIDPDGSLTMTDKSFRIHIARTETNTVFVINRKQIDLDDYENIQQLSEAITKMLPRFSKHSWFMNEAFAEAKTPARAVAAAALVVRSTADSGVCQMANRYLQKCLSTRRIGQTYLEIRKKKASHTPFEVLKEALFKKLYESDREHTEEQIRLFSRTLELDAKVLSLLKDKKEVLKSCPSVQSVAASAAVKRSAMDDVAACNSIVTRTQSEIKDLPPEEVPSFQEAMKELTKAFESLGHKNAASETLPREKVKSGVR